MSQKPQNKPCMSPLVESLLRDEKPLPMSPEMVELWRLTEAMTVIMKESYT